MGISSRKNKTMTEDSDNHTEIGVSEHLRKQEESNLSPLASRSDSAIRRREEQLLGYRQNFAQDADRILHSRAYARYIDKTQVFCLIRNDHITHRVLHVQLVSRIARTIGRYLFLNEDLIEAVSLGHDIGHPPFGHAGELFLSELCVEHGLPPFQHNIQSIRALEKLERKGRGWNLCLQTLDGILCHDGEVHQDRVSPAPLNGFTELDLKVELKSANPALDLQPMSPEGCVVRMADTVAYIGRDIEDAIILGLIRRSDLPERCVSRLGETNGSIVYSLVTDLIRNSQVPKPGDANSSESVSIRFSDEVASLLRELKEFNYRHIYLAPKTQEFMPLIKSCYLELFGFYLDHLENGTSESLEVDLLDDLDRSYIKNQPAAARVRDFIAGMTDEYFLRQAESIDCQIPPLRYKFS
ncbi:MAG: deoxyguanosinetriphosphate triphosphohydrolase family protein [Desulfocapsaceae bacterium]